MATEQQRQRVDGIVTREVHMATDATVDEERRTVTLSFSSEEPYLRSSHWDEPWIEVLGHNPGEVDTSRMDSAPVLLDHYAYDTRFSLIGAIDSFEFKNGRGTAVARLSKREDVDAIFQDIQDGIIRNVSVGYKINERVLVKQNEDGPDEYRVTNWTPMEVSFVTIPADPTVGVGRSESYKVIDLTQSKNPDFNQAEQSAEQGVKEMPNNIDSRAADAAGNDGGNPTEAGTTANDATRDAVTNTEAQTVDLAARNASIREAFGQFASRDGVNDLLIDSLSDPTITVDQARANLLTHLGSQSTPANPQGAEIAAAGSGTDDFRRDATDALLSRSGIIKPVDGNDMVGFSLREMARYALERSGVSTKGVSPMDMVGRAFTHSTGDFPLILANAVNKAVAIGFNEAPETWNMWARSGSLSDFKTASRVVLSAFNDLTEVKEGAEYKYGTFTEAREQITLATYGKMFSITRQAIINDDLDMFSRIPAGMGRAAARIPGDLAYGVLTDNANMSDGTALFASGHGNLASTGGAISVTTLDTADAAMGVQTDPSGNATLNINPRYLIVPRAKKITAQTLMASATDPSQSNSRKPNPFQNAFEVVADARLDGTSTTAWFLAADPNVHDTVEVAFLDGNQNPRVEQKDGWNVDGVEFKVSLDCAAKAIDYRGLYKNPGA